MLKHYLKIIIRATLKNKVYSLINIIGLTTGMVVFLLIMSLVYYEFSFDQYHENKDRIYRVVQEQLGNDYMGSNLFAVTPAPLAPTLMDEYDEVEKATRVMKGHNIMVGNGKESFLEANVFGVDAEVFDIFTFSYLQGNPEMLLTQKKSVVISESMAHKYFPNQEVIGQTLLYRNEHEFKIVGVVKDMPKNSHFVMSMMFHYESLMELAKRDMDSWGNSSFYTYILLTKKGDANVLEAKFPALRDKYTNDKIDDDGQSNRFYLQKLNRIHLYSNINFDIAANADVKYMYIYSAVALLILLIACINYMNLASALATRRAREIGIRKISGAFKHQLILQYLGEAFALTFMALTISLIVIVLIMPSFAEFVGRDITLNIQENPQWLVMLFLTCLFVGFMSGSYPAFRLSSIIPIDVLKGSYHKSAKGSFFRNLLVIMQFTISGVLIISTIIVSDQLHFIQVKDMGYSRDQIMIINIRDRLLIEKIPILKQELRQINGVVDVSSSTSLPNNISSSRIVDWPGRPEGEDIIIYSSYIDYNFIKLYDIDIVAGRNFSQELDNDKAAFLINEAAASALGWDNPLEHELIGVDTGRIVGIVKNFNQHSLHLAIMPLQLELHDSRRAISIKIAASEIPNTIAEIKKTKESFSSIYPFEYEFFDDVFNTAYKSEQKIGKLTRVFTILTIIIACLGMYGLASFTAEQRIKEVGIRKVLGARVFHLILLLSKDFTLLVVISFILSAPIAYFIMQQWLEDFAYHTNIGMFTFLSALVLMILVSWFTVAYRTFTVANSNPVKSLRDE
jgi:putative ABC transport system permease protein